MTKTCVIYGCGGAGVNTAAHYLNTAVDNRFTQFRAVALDTSRSNLMKHSYEEQDIYVIPDMDGAGGLRSFGANQIRPHIGPMIAKHPPGDLNIVVFAGGGGSGSVIGPLVAGRLIADGQDVIVIMVECGHNKVHMENTKNALATLKGIAVKNNCNVAVMLVPLEHQTIQNKKVWSHIGSLSILWSGKNERLDSQDLHHFLHHQVHTGVTGALNALQVTTNPEDVMACKQPLSIASIYRSPEMDQVHPTCIYHTHGFSDLEHSAFDQIHYCLSEAELVPFIDNINESVRKIEDSLNSVAKPSLGLVVDNAEDDGLVI